jgi:2-polyprenyl-6-methoxyphenol hydroxylase-like FAD-dependent oxidoreductase
MLQQDNQRAIVLGGSIAGLLAARVLADHFQQVLVIERDVLPEGAKTRKGAPQGQHQHALLARGYATMQELFPGLREELLAAGALIKDISADVRWHQGDYWRSFESGIPAVFISRPALEGLIRRRVQALPNVELRQQCAVQGLLTSNDHLRIVGVQVQERQTQQNVAWSADLVVDATGRGSPTPKWLNELGYQAPTEEVVNVGITYTTRLYQRTVSDDQALAYLCSPTSHQARRGGGVFPIDGNRWIVTLTGRQGEVAPSDEVGFLEYARSLPSLDTYQLIKAAEPDSEITVYKYPASRRRHYERLTRLPARLVVLGDAVCSFNPVYGQGMTVCVLEALALRDWWQAAAGRGQEPDTRRFFQAIARVIDTPWNLSTEAEKEFMPNRQPPRGAARWVAAYFKRLRQVSQHDPVASLAFIRVSQLLDSPTSLFYPRIMTRVLFGGRAVQQPLNRSTTSWRIQTA